MSKPSILFITTQLPYPPKSGGTIKSWNYINDLKSRYELGIVSLLKDDDAEHLDGFKKLFQFKHSIFQEVDVKRNLFTLLRSYLGFPCLNVYRNYSSKIKDEVDTIAGGYDAIIVDHYEVYQYVPRNFHGKVILHTHNAEFELWQRMAELNSNPLIKFALKLEAKRVLNYERAILKHSDLCYATPSDIKAYQNQGIDTQRIKVTYHLGNDELLELDELQFDKTEEALLFMGTLSWEPNIDGILWFVADVYPRLLSDHPKLTLYILGKVSDERLEKACSAYPGIKLCGFVDDINSYMKKSRVFIAPLRFGSGMKVKVLEGMYRGIPIVTTKVGAEGLSVEDQKELMITDNASAFAEKCKLLLKNKAIWDCLSSNSRLKAREMYRWKPLFDQMEQELKKVLN